MYFDPLSSWLVALICDGIAMSGGKSNLRTTSEYEKQLIKKESEKLNNTIRQIKKTYGLTWPTKAFEQVHFSIWCTRNYSQFPHLSGRLLLDLDTIEYLIELLEACAEWYRQHPTKPKRYSRDEIHKDADWYRNAATRARRKKEECVRRLEEEEKAREREINTTAIAILATILIFFVGLSLRMATAN